MSRRWRWACGIGLALGILGVVSSQLVTCAGPPRPEYARRRWAATVGGSIELTLAAGQRVRIETAGAPPANAARLHLWDPETGTEVAFGEPPWFGWNSALEYTNPQPKPRAYLLVYATSRPAKIDVLRDGRSWLQGVEAPHLALVPPGSVHAVQLASVPGRGKEYRLFGFDCEGRLRAVDRDSGPTGLPRIARDDLCSVSAQAPAGAELELVSVYANDRDDRDGDGLGRALERALGTCDGPREPGCATGVLAKYYRGRDATRDTDRDGVSDADEVFGAGPLLDFPRYGASPLHKDVFVEIDYDRRSSDLGLSAADLAEIAALYASGSARELENPDRKPGVALHFDVGFADPEHAHLFGDWGGSGRASATNYRAARASDFTPERAGTFRYAFTTKSGRGQARGDAFTVNRDLQRVSIFAHELGHTLGLAHHGHDDWGRSNCKPNYFSLMNYVYQNRPHTGFSRAEAGVVLDPAAVPEMLSLGDGLPPAEVLREPPLELDVLDGGVDWNRDGVISAEPVRAGLGWATYKSCGAAGHARTTLLDQQLRATTPSLARLGDRLYALFVTEDGALHTRHSALSGPDAAGSCPEGDGEDTRCSEWSLQSLVHGVEAVQHFGVLGWSREELLLGYVRADGQLRLALLAAKGEVLEVRSDREVPGARSDRAPALARVRVAGWRHGAQELLRLLYRTAEGALMQASARGPDGPFRIDAVVDAREEPIAVGVAPSVITLGTGESCAAFPDLDWYVRFYCYDPERDRWVDLSRSAFFSGLGPKTSGAVGLAFHRARLADGRLAVDDPTRGSLVMSFTEPESSYAKNPDNPHYFVSEWISAVQPARTHLYFRWRGSVIDEWTNLAPATSLSLYEDVELSALKGLMIAKAGNPEGLRLDFLPFADGAHEERMGAGNDFRVMALGICEGLKGAASCSPVE